MTETPPQNKAQDSNADQDFGDRAQDHLGVQRFTTVFDPHEDRLKLSVELKDGTTHLFWITRRLIVRVVPQLVAVLERHGRQKAIQHPEPMAPDNLQRRNQMAAVGGMKPQDAVVVKESEKSVLVSAVTLKQGPQTMHLVFRDGDKSPCLTVPFNEPLLRQWLGVVHQNFTVAGWQDDIWPDWMSLKGGKDAPGAPRLN